MSAATLFERFRAKLFSSGGVDPGERLVVAVSGGLDSCVLLHMLRFGDLPPLHMVAVHFDHSMRLASAEDARWVGGLCRAWDVELVTEAAGSPLRSEDEARDARYGFFERVRQDVGASRVLTGHHADDQAETVLFRVLRGTGIQGLAGIPEVREPGLFRPLLEFWREELEAYASRCRLAWLEDETNQNVGYARNAIRHRLLPEAEALVSEGARRSLARLAILARDNETAWHVVMPLVLDSLAFDRYERGTSVDWHACVALHPALIARVVRWLGAEADLSLDEAGTRLAVEFSSSARSGSRIDLGGGVELRRELDRLLVGRRRPACHDVPLRITDVGPGSGDVVLGGHTIPVAWGSVDAGTRRNTELFTVEELRFPLLVRSREPGDRIRLAEGSKKLKKLFLEARISSDERRQVPVLVDVAGDVVWIPGIARATASRAPAGAPAGAPTLTIGIG